MMWLRSVVMSVSRKIGARRSNMFMNGLFRGIREKKYSGKVITADL